MLTPDGFLALMQPLIGKKAEYYSYKNGFVERILVQGILKSYGVKGVGSGAVVFIDTEKFEFPLQAIVAVLVDDQLFRIKLYPLEAGEDERELNITLKAEFDNQ